MVQSDEHEAQVRVDKGIEGWALFRAGVPLVASGIGPAFLYAWLASSSGLARYWIGPPLMLSGAALAVVGIVRRAREIRSPDLPNTRHYWMLFVGWTLIMAGLLIPPYSYA